MGSKARDRFFVTLGRLMYLAGMEYEVVKKEQGEEWNFLTERQRFDILDKHVLEITADVISDLPAFMQELKLSVEQFNLCANKGSKESKPKSETVAPAAAKKGNAADCSKKCATQQAKKTLSPETKKKSVTEAKKSPKKTTSDPALKKTQEAPKDSKPSAETKNSENESSPRGDKNIQTDVAANDATISLQVNIHHLKQLLPTQLKILLKNMANDRVPEMEVLEAIINENEQSASSKAIAGPSEKSPTKERLDPEIEELFASVSQGKLAEKCVPNTAAPVVPATAVPTPAVPAPVMPAPAVPAPAAPAPAIPAPPVMPKPAIPTAPERPAEPTKPAEIVAAPAAPSMKAPIDVKAGDDEDLEEVFRAISNKTPYFPTQCYFGRTFVVDNGSQSIRAGFGDEQHPKVVIANAVEQKVQTPEEKKQQEAGEGSKSSSILRYTMEDGVIKHWDDMQALWTHIFKSLFINPAEHPVLMSNVATTPREDRKRITEIMFEEYNVPGFSIQNQSVLSMYGAGTPTGIAVNIGDSIATILPVYEYNPIPHALQSSKIAGRFLNRQLVRAMKRHYLDDRHITNHPALAREIKEKYCYIASDFYEEMRESTKSPGIQKAVCNPGLEVFLSDEVFTVPEALFKPHVVGEENYPGLCDLILNSVRNVDVQLRPNLCENIVLSGGTTLLPGFVERMRKELLSTSPAMKVLAPNYRDELAWRGGSILASLPTFQNGLVTPHEYKEYGADIICKKCS